MSVSRIGRVLGGVVLALVLLAGPAAAQTYVRLWPNGASGSIDANGEAVTVTNAREMGTIGVQITGTFTGTLAAQCSVDGSTWQAVRITPTNTTTAVTSVTGTGVWTGAIAGCKSVRVASTAWTSGTAVVTVNTTQGGGGGSSGGGAATASLTLQEADDASIASGQTADAVINLAQIYDTVGTAWKRLSGNTGVTDGGTQRVTLATDDAAAVDLSDISGFTSSAATDLAYIRANLSIDAVSDQAALTQGPQIMGFGSTATPTAMSADGDATRFWLDLVGRIHSVFEGIEDAPETAGGFLSMSGTVRRDTMASSAGTSGDNATLNTDASGRLWVSATVLEDAPHSSGDAGAFVLGRRIDTLAASSGTSGDYEALNMNNVGAVWTTPVPSTNGGLTIFRSLDLDETEEEIKGTAGQVYAMWVTNTATSTRFIKCYNATAANVTVGTTTPVITIGIPGNATDDIAGNFGPGAHGAVFDTAITCAATTGVADNDTGAPGANDVIINAFYK